MEKIRLGIMGTGNMGKNHVRLAREHRGIVDLVGVYDPDAERLEQMGLSDIGYMSDEELMDDVDALIVAAPSSIHKNIGLKAAQHGCHLLMEKPLALSYDDAKQVTDAYNNIGKILMVGHVERYNPVIEELEKVLSSEKIIAVEIDRCSPMNRRISDTDVIYDLMIHDVDILVNAIMNGKSPDSLHAFGTISYSEKFKDYVQSLCKFEDGVVASIVSSRATEGKIRSIRVHCENACVDADLLHKRLEITRKTQYTLEIGYVPTYKQEIVKEEIFVPNVEALKAEQMHFFDCIKNGTEPKTSGASALNSLKVLDEIKREVYK